VLADALACLLAPLGRHTAEPLADAFAHLGRKAATASPSIAMTPALAISLTGCILATILAAPGTIIPRHRAAFLAIVHRAIRTTVIFATGGSSLFAIVAPEILAVAVAIAGWMLLAHRVAAIAMARTRAGIIPRAGAAIVSGRGASFALVILAR